ncbi:MAG: IPTL-CTERM sorting domain-containing protein [candidate division Zixibacteria bacterium]|nr:IPTL-CTERM sorting domain-containing protein [candidate division Zixibacteria bacterium]
MDKTIKAEKAINEQPLLKSSFAKSAATVACLLVLISLFISVPAQSSSTVYTQLSFSGFINEDTVCYVGLAVTDCASHHMVASLDQKNDNKPRRTTGHTTKQTRDKCHSNLSAGIFDVMDLCDGNYDLRTMWIEPDDDTVTLVQNVSSSVSGDTIYVIATGVWSGTCDDWPDSATVLINDIEELWHQVEPGHVRMTYVQTHVINGEPGAFQVVKDLTYAGDITLACDQVLRISNIVVQFDPVSRVEHSECDLHMALVSHAIPTLTEWGLIIFSVLLLGWMAWAVVRRRRGVTVRM